MTRNWSDYIIGGETYPKTECYCVAIELYGTKPDYTCNYITDYTPWEHYFLDKNEAEKEWATLGVKELGSFAEYLHQKHPDMAVIEAEYRLEHVFENGDSFFEEIRDEIIWSNKKEDQPCISLAS